MLNNCPVLARCIKYLNLRQQMLAVRVDFDICISMFSFASHIICVFAQWPIVNSRRLGPVSSRSIYIYKQIMSICM